MGVDVLQASDIIDLSQFFRSQIQRREHFIKMLHVLKDKCFSLIKDEVLNICKEICVDLLL